MMSQRMHSGSSIRKTWHMCDAGKGSTHRLRYQLAEDGCKESQFAVAKGLLREFTNSKEEHRVNAEIAVYWLVQAANQGHQEAASLLHECYQSGTGITSLNRAWVEKSLNNSENEKLANKVGHSIYKAVMIDCCDDTLPMEIFQERTTILISQEKRKQTEEVPESPSFPPPPSVTNVSEISKTKPTEKVSSREIITSVKQCLDGDLPLVAFKTVGGQYEKRSLLRKLIVAPWVIFHSCVEAFIEGLSSCVPPLTVLLMTLTIWSLSIIFLPTSRLIRGHVFHFGFFTLSLISLLTMISTSCYIILLNAGFYTVCTWLQLVKLFDPDIQIDKVQKKYLGKKMQPLVAFLGSTMIFVVTYPLLDTRFSPTDFVFLAFLLMIWSYKTAPSHTYLEKLSLVLNVVLCLHKGLFSEQISLGWLFGFDFDYNFPLSQHIQIHLSTLSCLTFILVALYIMIVLSDRKQGGKILLSHLMTIVWLNLGTAQLKSIQMLELLYSTAFWSTVLVLSRLTAAFPALVILASVKYIALNNENWALLFMVVLLFSICLFISKTFMYYIKPSLTFKTVTVFIGIITFVTILQCIFSPSTERYKSVMTWDSYQKYCHRSAWDSSNIAEVEMACLPLKGQRLATEGTISSITTVSVDNYLNHVINFLPSPLSEWISCAFGKPYPVCNESSLSSIEKDRCLLYHSLGLKGCNLEGWNNPKFEITLEIAARFSPELYLIVTEHCRKFVMMIKEGDTLQIEGSLMSNIGGLKPKIQLEKAICHSCYEEIFCEPKLPYLEWPHTIEWTPSLHNFVFIFLSPIIETTENGHKP